MSTNAVTKQEVEEIVERIVGKATDDAVTGLASIIADFAQQVDDRFNIIEYDIRTIKRELVSIHRRIDLLDPAHRIS